MKTRSLVGLAAAAVVISSVALDAARSDTPVARSPGDPIAQSVILDGHLRTSTRLAIRYVIAGNTAVYSDASTGDPILADGGELGSVRVYIDGRLRGGSDAGSVTCAAHTRIREYYDQFPGQTFRVRAGDQHPVRVVTHYCAPDGTESRTSRRLVIG